MHLVFILCLVLTSQLVTGATWSPSPPPHHRFVVEFDEEPDGNTKVSISQDEDSGRELFGKYKYKLASVIEKTKNVVSGKSREVSNKFHNFEEQAKEVIDEAVGKFADPKAKSPENLWEKVKAVGKKAVGKFADPKVKSPGNLREKVKVVGEMAGMARSLVGITLGTFSIGSGTSGTLKDSAVKVEEWDLVDSPKRIGEDIERNASRKVEQGVEEVKETVQIVKETSFHDLLTRSTRKVTVLVDVIQSVISWCHLLGFSLAYGMGVWVTFFSSSVLRKCLPKEKHHLIENKLYMVYFRAMAYFIGTALIGYLVSRGRKVFYLSNKMDIFQGFILLSALIMSLTNMMFLEPRTTKLDDETKKVKEKDGTTEKNGTTSVAAKKLKKLNRYSATLNMSTMVVLTWHLAYVGQLLEAARHP